MGGERTMWEGVCVRERERGLWRNVPTMQIQAEHNTASHFTFFFLTLASTVTATGSRWKENAQTMHHEYVIRYSLHMLCSFLFIILDICFKSCAKVEAVFCGSRTSIQVEIEAFWFEQDFHYVNNEEPLNHVCKALPQLALCQRSSVVEQRNWTTQRL